MTTTTEAPTITVGAALTSEEQYRSLPIGTTLITERRTTWTKIDEDTFESTSGTKRAMSRFNTAGTNHITSVPPDLTSTENPVEGVKITALPETLEQFKQRFETTMWGCTQYQSVSTDSHEQAFRDLGCVSPPVPTPGMTVCQSDFRVIRTLPVGTVLRSSLNPKETNYSIARINRQHEWQQVLGTGGGNFHVWHVLTMPGVEPAPYTTEEWSMEMVEPIFEWTRQAYAVGMRVKSNHGWCETFDSMLHRTGVDREAAENRPRLLTAEQVAELPAGTVLRYTARAGTALLVRDNRYTNPARTRWLSGSVEGDWAPAGLERVAGATATNLNVPVKSRAEMDSMPVGTVVQDGVGTVVVHDGSRASVRYTKQDNGTWLRPDYGAYHSVDLTLARLRYVSIGAVSVGNQGA